MRVKRFFAPDLRQARRSVREELGDDVFILSSEETADGAEIICALDYDPNADPKDLAEAVKEAKRGDALHQELNAARQRILSGVVFDSSTSETAFKNPNSWHSGEEQAPPKIEEPPEVKETQDYNAKVIQAMESEIQSLRNLLQNQMSKQESYAHPVEALMRNRLKLAGFSKNYINYLLDLTSLDVDTSPTTAWQKLLQVIENQILIHDGELIEKGGVIAVFGPTGVGKTTTLSKLAARYVLKYGADGLALVTTDCYRIAAYEQLRTVGRILGVTVRVVDENNSLEMTLRSLKRKNLILIDTAGLNVKDPNLKTQINLLASSNVKIKRFLVMPATSQAKVLLANYEAYKNLGLNGCILTKVDEAANIGEALGVVVEKRLPLTYFTNGQKIPDDVVLASKEYLLQRLIQDIEAIEAG